MAPKRRQEGGKAAPVCHGESPGELPHVSSTDLPLISSAFFPETDRTPGLLCGERDCSPLLVVHILAFRTILPNKWNWRRYLWPLLARLPWTTAVTSSCNGNLWKPLVGLKNNKEFLGWSILGLVVQKLWFQHFSVDCDLRITFQWRNWPHK